ncbi:uncharacterized protein LOC102069436 [Zonotrichia albicollis]|uniref:uncharacterized protein LOC102069436 n=1 Tax=Zonotrichia albicollis TaxID=44394 RepID=UPI003D80EBD0
MARRRRPPDPCRGPALRLRRPERWHRRGGAGAGTALNSLGPAGVAAELGGRAPLPPPPCPAPRWPPGPARPRVRVQRQRAPGCADTFPERPSPSPARAPHASMALPQRALTFFLALAPLLLARGQTQRGPVTPWVRQEAETCQKPHWDIRLAPDQESYRKNEEVILSCPKGFQPPFTHAKCTGKVLSVINGKPIHREAWTGKDSRGNVINIQTRFRVQCLDVRQVVPKIPEISSTSIKLKWTCRFPHICQNIRARCQTEWHSSSDCETEEVKVEEMLQGWEGTFICSPLQPFTVYSVTISRLPSTILYADLHTTKEMVPDKPEKLWVDTSTGSLRWKPLSSCKGEITGYQLNITTMRAEDGSFIDFSQVLVNQSVSEYVPPHQTAGNKYLVTVQGLTAAGAGPASQLEFQTYVLGLQRACSTSAILCAFDSRPAPSTLPLKKVTPIPAFECTGGLMVRER